MDTRRLVRTDLNLLVSLQVLLEEQNVSRAAERLFITQSAMSKTLSRLRDLFDDPLFTRSSHGVVPTPRAVELHAELENVLQQFDSLLGHRDIDPGHFEGRFQISALDFFSLPVMPSLVKSLRENAPGMRIKVSQDTDHQLKDMVEGRIDLTIQARRITYDEEFVVETLCVTEPIFLLRKDHPLKTLKKVTWRDVIRYPEVALKVPSAENARGSWLRARLLRYLQLSRIVLETPDYLSALQTIASTDSIMFTPRMSMGFVKDTGAITSIPLPGREGKEKVEIVLVFHKRTENSPVHIWMRDQIKQIYANQWAIIEGRSKPRSAMGALQIVGDTLEQESVDKEDSAPDSESL